MIYPVVMNIITSFTEWKGYGPWKWIGLANYKTMLADGEFWTSIINTGLMVLYIPLSTIVTLLIAAFLREEIRGWKVYRAVLYIPNLLGYVLMGVIFSIYLRDDGALEHGDQVGHRIDCPLPDHSRPGHQRRSASSSSSSCTWASASSISWPR